MVMSVRDFSSASAMRSETCFEQAERKWLRAACIAGIAAWLTACNLGSALGGDDDDDTFHIRSLNLIGDSAAIKVLIDTTTIATLEYSNGTAFSAAHPGMHDISLQAVLPTTFDDEDDDDDPIQIGATLTRSFIKNVPYTLVAYGSEADPQMFFIEGQEQRSDVADDRLVLQFVDAAPAASQVEVYVTLPQAGVAAPQLVTTLSLAEASGPQEFALVRNADDLDDDSTLTGKLTIELRTVGSAEVLYKSAEITVTEQSRILFAIAGSRAPGPASVRLVSLAGSSAAEFLERNDGAELRFVHASVDTPALDVAVGPNYNVPAFAGLAFRGASGYIDVKRDDVDILASQSGTNSGILFLESFSALPGQAYSAYAIGTLADVDAVVVGADSRSVPTQNKFRFLLAAASLYETEPLDIYLRLPGDIVDFDDDDTTPTFSSVAYQNSTSYLTYKEGSYDVYFAYAGTSTIALGPASFTTHNGDIDTLVLIDNESGGLELMTVGDRRD